MNDIETSRVFSETAEAFARGFRYIINKGGARSGKTFSILLGKAIRWYHSTATMTAIHYAKNNNKVPKSDGAKPVMNYPDKLPSDIDYQFYIQEAKNIIKSTGVNYA